jgi:hypothetical protein
VTTVRFWSTLFRAVPAPAARRIDEREAEEILQGISTSADRAELLRLLERASAPPRVDELMGADEVIAAYRDTWNEAPVVPAPRHRPLWRLLSRALLVKVLAGIGVLVLGGAAVAAGTGNLPAGVQHGAHDLLSPLGVPVPDKTAVASGTPRGSVSHGTTPAGHTAPPGGTPSAAPAPLSPVALCEAWRDTKKGKQGNGMDPAQRKLLENAAGGPNRVRAYCTTVLGTDPGGPAPEPTPAPSPTPKSHPDPHPSKPDKTKRPKT